MRKQYHSKKIKNQIFIWDVHHLISKSENFPIVKIKLSKIKEFQKNYWFQGESDVPTCESIVEHYKLVEECDLKFPIILAADGSIMDGMHRVCKAYLSGQESIKAVKFEETPPPDYIDVPLDELPYD